MSLGTPLSSAIFKVSGHSLTDQTEGGVEFLADWAEVSWDWQRQMILGSTIGARTQGWIDPPGEPWPGYAMGLNRIGDSLDLIKELRNPQTVAGPYTHLVIAERPDLPTTVDWARTVPLLRHYYELFRENNSSGVGLFFASWPAWYANTTQDGPGDVPPPLVTYPLGSSPHVIEIQNGGTIDTATFRWSPDGGDNWAESNLPMVGYEFQVVGAEAFGIWWFVGPQISSPYVYQSGTKYTFDRNSPLTTWLAATYAQQLGHAAVGSRVNASLALESRSDRLITIPTCNAVAKIVELATTGEGIPGLTQDTVADTVAELFHDDIHQTTLGKFLTCCVVFGSIYRIDPLSAPTPDWMSGEDPDAVAAVKQVASGALNEWFDGAPLGVQYDTPEAAKAAFVDYIEIWCGHEARANKDSLIAHFEWTDTNMHFDAGTDSSVWFPAPASEPGPEPDMTVEYSANTLNTFATAIATAAASGTLRFRATATTICDIPLETVAFDVAANVLTARGEDGTDPIGAGNPLSGETEAAGTINNYQLLTSGSAVVYETNDLSGLSLDTLVIAGAGRTITLTSFTHTIDNPS